MTTGTKSGLSKDGAVRSKDASSNFHVGDQSCQRLRQISRTAQLQPIWIRYRNLLDRSLDARYECVQFESAQVQSLRRNTFLPLRQHLAALLGI